MSGTTPFPLISAPRGVLYFATVNTTAEASVSRWIDCTRALPNVVCPITSAARLSRRAAAKTSAAEAHAEGGFRLGLRVQG